MKAYDRGYFERGTTTPTSHPVARPLERKVALAVAAAEFVLGRRIRSALDVGCGEACGAPHQAAAPESALHGSRWQAYAVRPRLRRNIAGALRDLGDQARRPVRPGRVLGRAPLRAAKELGPGIRAVGELTQGLPGRVFTLRRDRGDHVEYHERPTALYQRLFRVGMLPGLYAFVPRSVSAR